MKKIFSFIFIFSFSFLSFANPPEYTISWDLDFTCKNTDSQNCYPFLYMTSEQDISLFPNIVSLLNVLSPVFTIGTLSINYWLNNKIKKNINNKINEELLIFDNLAKQLSEFLIQVIAKFDNNIGGDYDLVYINSVISTLNSINCSNCIEEFVNIVSEKFLTNSQSDNHERFIQFVNKITLQQFNKQEHNCVNNDEIKINLTQKIARSKKDFNSTKYKNIISNLYNKYSHPFHLTNTLFALVAWSACSITPQFINTDNRAGAYFGDMANVINAIIIPLIGPLSILQQVCNSDKEEKQKLHEEIIKKLHKLNGIIKISALIIGKMDNQINLQEAKGLIKALLITKWPKNLADQFLQVASEGDLQLKKELKLQLQKLIDKSFPYYDEDIDVALKNDIQEVDINI